MSYALEATIKFFFKLIEMNLHCDGDNGFHGSDN